MFRGTCIDACVYGGGCTVYTCVWGHVTACSCSHGNGEWMLQESRQGLAYYVQYTCTMYRAGHLRYILFFLLSTL